MRPRSVTTALCLLAACIPVLAGSHLHAAGLQVTEPSLECSGLTMAGIMDFGDSGLARATYDRRAKRVSLVRGNTTLLMTIGAKQARLNGVAVQSPVPAVVWKERAMVPARFALDALGLTDVGIKLPTRSGSAASSQSVITGRVMYAGNPLPGVVLRLVRAADFSFVPGFRARTDASGSYSFANMPDGAYRVYAYAGDNPGYFNRTTPVVRLARQSCEADSIRMGRILAAQDPPRGAILSHDRDLVFTWIGCPSATRYHLSVVNPATSEEVFSAETDKPYCTVPVSHMAQIPLYEWRVIATDSSGEFLGGTPGNGGAPLVFGIASD